MTMLDRIALAKAGYKKKEIEEMLAAEDVNNEETQPAAEDQEEAPEKEEAPDKEEAIEKEETPEKEEDELIEELQNKVLDLEKKLSNAQANNINHDRNIENPIEKAEQKLYDVITNFG